MKSDSYEIVSGVINGLTLFAMILLLCINLPLHAIALAILYHAFRTTN